MQPGIDSSAKANLRKWIRGLVLYRIVNVLSGVDIIIDVSLNILLGFPGETNAVYQQQMKIIPSLQHLQPPESTSKLWLERFIPYYKWPERYGIRLTGPGLAYGYMYDERKVDLNKMAYDFEYEID